MDLRAKIEIAIPIGRKKPRNEISNFNFLYVFHYVGI
jgi:hypothetical protein